MTSEALSEVACKHCPSERTLLSTVSGEILADVAGGQQECNQDMILNRDVRCVLNQFLRIICFLCYMAVPCGFAFRMIIHANGFHLPWGTEINSKMAEWKGIANKVNELSKNFSSSNKSQSTLLTWPSLTLLSWILMLIWFVIFFHNRKISRHVWSVKQKVF